MKPVPLRLWAALAFLFVSLGLIVLTLQPPQYRNINQPVAQTAGFPGQISLRVPQRVMFHSDAFLRVQLAVDEGAGERLLRARLELPAASLGTPPEVLAPLSAGQPILVQWQIIPMERGHLDGTLWLYTQAAESGAPPQAFLSLPIRIEVVDFLGFPPAVLRWAGGLGLAAALWLSGAGRWIKNRVRNLWSA